MRVARLDDRTLVIRSGFPLLTSLIVRLDKATGMGVFKKHGVLTNRRNMQFRLGEITDARVLKEQRGSGMTYHASIKLERDGSIRMEGSRSETMTMVSAIREFLQIPSDGRY